MKFVGSVFRITFAAVVVLALSSASRSDASVTATTAKAEVLESLQCRPKAAAGSGTLHERVLANLLSWAQFQFQARKVIPQSLASQDASTNAFKLGLFDFLMQSFGGWTEKARPIEKTPTPLIISPFAPIARTIEPVLVDFNRRQRTWSCLERALLTSSVQDAVFGGHPIYKDESNELGPLAAIYLDHSSRQQARRDDAINELFIAAARPQGAALYRIAEVNSKLTVDLLVPKGRNSASQTGAARDPNLTAYQLRSVGPRDSHLLLDVRRKVLETAADL